MVINATHGVDVRDASSEEPDFVKPLISLMPTVFFNEQLREMLPLCFVSHKICISYKECYRLNRNMQYFKFEKNSKQ